MQEFEKHEIEKMLELRKIEPAQTEWDSPIVLRPKRDGTVRFRIDILKLNAESVPD